MYVNTFDILKYTQIRKFIITLGGNSRKIEKSMRDFLKEMEYFLANIIFIFSH